MKLVLLHNQILWTSKNKLEHQLPSGGSGSEINVVLNKKILAPNNSY